MKIKNDVRTDVSDFSIASILKILADHGISPEAARLEAEIESDYGTFGSSEHPHTFLCFTEELDAFKVKARIDEHIAVMGVSLGWSSAFVKFLNLASKVWTHTQRGIFMDKMKIDDRELSRLMGGGYPSDLKCAYAALSASLA